MKGKILRLDKLDFKGKFVKMSIMSAAPQLDHEFMEYWLKLSFVQKESLLSVAKNFVQLTDESDIDDIRKKVIIDERAKYLRGEGVSYSWEQVRQMAINKDQRDGL